MPPPDKGTRGSNPRHLLSPSTCCIPPHLPCSTNISKHSARFPWNASPTPEASESWQCQQGQPGEEQVSGRPRDEFEVKDLKLCTALPSAEEELNIPKSHDYPAWGTSHAPLTNPDTFALQKLDKTPSPVRLGLHQRMTALQSQRPLPNSSFKVTKST